MNKKLFYCYGETEDIVFQRIDESGGWPHNGKSLVYKHTGEQKRPCYFSASENVRDEWNTSIFTSDDYYWWKLSQSRKDKFKKEVIREVSAKLFGSINNL